MGDRLIKHVSCDKYRISVFGIIGFSLGKTSSALVGVTGPEGLPYFYRFSILSRSLENSIFKIRL